MKNIISTLILVAFVVAGAVAADFVKSSKTTDGDHGTEKTDDAKAKDHDGDKQKKSDKKDKKKKESASKKKGSDKKANADSHSSKDKSAEKDDYASGGATGVGNYVKFNRQFVVPIVKRDRVTSLIILTLNLEVEPSIYDKAYALEPKLRANLMNELLVLSNNGAFSQNMTNPDNLKAVKKALFRTTRDLLGDEVKDILILELTRQDQ